MIDIRLQKVQSPASLDVFIQLMVVVREDDKEFGEALVFRDISSRAELVEGLLNLAAAIEKHA